MTSRPNRIALSLWTALALIASPVSAQSQTTQDQTTVQTAPAQAAPQNEAAPAGQQANPPAGPPAAAPAQGAPATAPADQSRSLKSTLDFSRARSPFPNFISPFRPAKVDLPLLTNSPRVDQLLQSGKLMLSLDDAISLALENNLDIMVQRFTPWLAEASLLRTRAGGPAGLVNVPGVTTWLGSIPSVSFDPTFTASANWVDNNIPVNNPFLSGTGTSGVGKLTNHSAVYDFGLTQGLHTGTAITAQWNNTRQSSSSAANLFNPSVQSNVFISIQQQLLNGFGILPNTRFILEAKNTKKEADMAFANQVITTVSQVENLYWELVFARQNVDVVQAALQTSQKLYEDNQKQVEIGTLAPIEVVRAESEVATDRQNLIVAQTTQLQQETLLLNAITKDPMDGPLQGVEIVPTTPLTVAQETPLVALPDAIKEAFQRRPDLLEEALALKNAGIEVRATRNALLPQLTLTGSYNTVGLAGNSITRTPSAGLVAVTSEPIVTAGGAPTGTFVGTPASFALTPVPGGLGNALGQITANKFPTYTVGLNLTLPVRNRAAQADNARALLDERQTEAVYRQLQNTIIANVHNAEIALEQDRARVDAAQKASELARQTLDAEQKKYKLGASTSFLVIQDQRDLTSALGTEIRAKIDLLEAQVTFDQVLGRTLDVNHIAMADALRGRAYNVPSIPGAPDIVSAYDGK